MTKELSRRDFMTRMAGAGALLGTPGAVRMGAVGADDPPLDPSAATRIVQETIPTRRIPGTEESLPIVGFGSSKAVLEIPEEGVEPVAEVMRQLIEHGGRVVDTSVRSEDIDRAFGAMLQREGFHERVFLTTKLNTTDPATGIAQFRQTQRLLGRRSFDLVQIESLRGLNDHWPRLLEWKDSGEARYIGVTVQSRADHDRLERFMRAESPDFVHVNYSVLEPEAEERLLPLARDRGMAVLVNRPFMNGVYFGRVSGRALPAWAEEFDCHAWSQFSVKYILANPAVTCVLTETTNPEHMEENIGGALGRFPDEPTLRRMRDLARTW